MSKYPKIPCAKEKCRAWAMRDSTFCRIHNPELPPNGGRFDQSNGFQPGNQLSKGFSHSRKHGFYAKYLSEDEEEFTRQEKESPSGLELEDIIILAKIGARRALKAEQTEPLYKMVSLLTKIKELEFKMNPPKDKQSELQEAINDILREIGLGESS